MTRVLVAAAALLVLPACNPKKEEAAKERDPPLVRLARPKRQALDRTLEVTGTVEAMTYVAVNPRIEAAEILDLKVDVGDRVAAGDVLATFDPTDAIMLQDDAKLAQAEAIVRVKDAEVTLKELQAQVRAQQQSLDLARKSLERGQAQAEKGAISQEALDALQFRFDQETTMGERLLLQIDKAHVSVEMAKKTREKADLQLAKADRLVAWATLRAPIAGIVAKRKATIGQQTLFTSLAREALFELFDPASLVVNIQVTQRDLPFIRANQEVEIRSDAVPGETFPGHVAIVSPVIDAATGTVPVRIAITDHENLKPGLFVAGRIVLEERPGVLVIPKKAVLYERERPYVMKVTGDGAEARASRVFFREGLSGREEVEVIVDGGALAEGDRIVLVGQDRLRDGDSVRIEEPEAGAAPDSKPAAPAHGG